METVDDRPPQWLSRPTLYPTRAKWLRRFDAFCQIAGVSAVVVGHGLRASGIPPWEFGAIAIVCMALISGAILLRYRWSLARPSFATRHRSTVFAAVAWGVAMLGAIIVGPVLPDTNGPGPGDSRFWACVHVSELLMMLYSVSGLIRGLRNLAAGGINPAFLLVASFGVLITVGTGLLMLPICRAQEPDFTTAEGAPFLVALFTSTSASCVTGLVVVDTGTYWSRIGQIVILTLLQIGGLGIMTFGAFFAVVAGKKVRLTEFATVRDLLASEGLSDVRRLVRAILGFTLISEAVGAVLLLPLWSNEPWGERLFMGLFHSVSAFCNAGFSLTPNSFVGMGDRWPVAGVLAILIIVGGVGFAVLYNSIAVLRAEGRRIFGTLLFNVPRERVHFTLTSRLVLVTTVSLLAFGTAAIFLLERTGGDSGDAPPIALVDAWFQSVTFRTAGFNTVDIGGLEPATKLIGILLMVVGASPGSTGGGIKTVVFAVAVVGLLSVLRGRDRVECWGRTLPSTVVNRAMAILFVSIITMMTTTILITLFERQPQRFLEHMFEAASAVGTVGLSSTVELDDGTVVSTTESLSSASRVVIVFAMFLGRVGPLTLLLALSGQASAIRYEYPPERVTLG
ncbi:Ktr system potassium uptake protein B (K(+)-uptake protein KtrB) [Durusdinium trenchii]|uniref:Ktr system potassium uptake protein B (K(+)-uptake protein KtrB) n=1 Tax=Durusdinium trenchii TaxID=1381693 RepID=A0ABP0RXP9_9DINO